MSIKAHLKLCWYVLALALHSATPQQGFNRDNATETETYFDNSALFD